MAIQRHLSDDLENRVTPRAKRYTPMGIIIMLFTLGVLGYLIAIFFGAAFRVF